MHAINISTYYEIWCDECVLHGAISINFNQQYEFENYMFKTYRVISQEPAECSMCYVHDWIVFLCCVDFLSFWFTHVI